MLLQTRLVFPPWRQLSVGAGSEQFVLPAARLGLSPATVTQHRHLVISHQIITLGELVEVVRLGKTSSIRFGYGVIILCDSPYKGVPVLM